MEGNVGRLATPRATPTPPERFVAALAGRNGNPHRAPRARTDAPHGQPKPRTQVASTSTGSLAAEGRTARATAGALAADGRTKALVRTADRAHSTAEPTRQAAQERTTAPGRTASTCLALLKLIEPLTPLFACRPTPDFSGSRRLSAGRKCWAAGNGSMHARVARVIHRSACRTQQQPTPSKAGAN